MGIVTVELFVLGSLAGLEEVGGPKFLKIPRSFPPPPLDFVLAGKFSFQGSNTSGIGKIRQRHFLYITLIH